MALVVKRFEVYRVNLDPTIGSEIRNPTRVPCQFQGKQGQVVLDQVRTVDKSRLVAKLGRISKQVQEEVLSTLGEMFAR